MERMTDLGKRILAERWPGQELDTLVRAHEAGVTVPYPVEFTGDGLLMQLLGDDGVAAPRLVNARLDPAAAAAAPSPSCRTSCGRSPGPTSCTPTCRRTTCCGGGTGMWTIDFPQAVDLLQNPHGFDLLHHDVTTMCTWFTRQGVDTDAEALFAELLAEAF